MSLKNKMTKFELEFLKAIPSGMGNPKPRRELEVQFGLNKRQVEEMIENLKRYGCPIVARKKQPSGYYIPTNERERYEGLKSYKNQIRTSLKIIDIVESVDLNNFNAFMEDLRHV